MTASVLQEAFADDAFAGGLAITSPALTSFATAGSLIEAWITCSATTTPPATVQDSAGQTYTFKKTVFNAGVGNQALHLFVFQNNASTAKFTVTATWVAGQLGKGIWVKEIGGVTATAYDNSQLDILSDPGTGANLVAGTAITPTNAPALCSCITMECSIGNGSDLAVGTGYTLSASAPTGGWAFGGANVLAKTQSKRIASATSTADLMTAATNGAAGTYLLGIAMYDEAGAGGAALSGSASDAVTATGALSTAIKAAAAATDTTSATGALSTGIKLAGAASDTTTGAGTMRNNPLQTGAVAWSTGLTAPSTLPGLPKAGNQIIVAAFAYTAGSGAIVSGIVDNAVGSAPYVKVIASTDFSNQRRIEYWWCPSVGTASGTFSVTPTFSLTGRCASALLECGGLTAIDQSGSFAPTVAGATLTATASAPNANANDFVIGMLGVSFNGTNPVPSDPAATGYTSWFNDIGFGTNFVDTEASYKNVGSIETSSAAWTFLSNVAAGIVASFTGPSGVVSGLAGGASSAVTASGALSTAIRLAAVATDAISAAASLTAQIQLAAAAASAVTASGSLSTQVGLGSSAVSTTTASGTLIPFATVTLTSPLYTGIGGILDPNFWLQSNLPAVGDLIWYDPTFLTILANGEIVSTSNNCSGVVQFNDGTGWAVGLVVITPLMVGYALDLNSATGNLSSALKLASAATSLTTAVGSLSTQINMVAAASTLTSAAAALSTAIKLAGAAIDVTLATGGLPGSSAQLFGAASDSTAASALLTTQISLAGAAQNFITATGAIIAQIQLAAAAIDTTQAAGGLLGTSAQFAGSAFDASSATAVLTTQILLSGAASNMNAASGSITAQIQILGAAVNVTSASGKLGAQILLGWTPRTVNTAYYDPALQSISGPTPYAEFFIRVADQLAFAIDWTGFVAITWIAGAQQPMGRTLRPTSPNGYAFTTADGGQSGFTEPTWPSRLGALVEDGSVTLECVPVDNSSLAVTVSGAVWAPAPGVAVLAQGQVGQVTTVAIDATQATKGVDYQVNCDVTFSDGESKTGIIVLKVR